MKRKSSKAQPRNSHSYFQTSLEYVIGEIKFALRVLAVNVDDFSSPASTAKGEWSGHLDNHYSAFGRKKKNPKKKCHGNSELLASSFSHIKHLFHSFNT